MIEPGELRIGNLIAWNPKLSHPGTTLPSTQVKVTSIFQDKIGYISPELEYRVEPFEDDLLQIETAHKLLEELEPIPLTAELLKKCGFETLPGEMYTHGYLTLQELQDNNTKVFQFHDFEFKPKIRYLHQLQNFYFALMGEELEVSLYS